MEKGLVYFNYVGLINEAGARNLIREMSDVLSEGAIDVYLNIASPGGRTEVGFALYNFLRALPAEVTTHSLGAVDSAALMVFLAGEVRKASPISSFMIHRPRQDLPHSHEFGRFHLALLARDLEVQEEFTKTILAERTALSPEQIANALEEGRRFRPQEALDAGIVSAIDFVAPPPGARIIAIGG